MLELPDHTVLIGVDAGATEVKVHQVMVLSGGTRPTLGLGPASASCCYDRVSGFRPVPIEEQRAELERALAGQGQVEPRELERRQGGAWIEAASGSILAVAAQARRARALVGIGVPGLKTPDGRGTAVVRNGPRIPDFAAAVEARLAAGRLELVRPVGPLSSDGDDCGRGEEADPHGQFRGVENAYYLGGGTGVAEALKLRGELVPFDDARWLAKAWQVTSSLGRNYEDALSTRGINATYAADSGRPEPIGQDEFPEERALAGDVVADAVMKEAAFVLAELVFARMVALRHGSRVPGSNGAGRHPYVGLLFDRVVIGQRLGRIFGEPRLARVFRQRVEEALANQLLRSQYVRMRARYVHGGRLRPGFLRASRLRAAPALGAAAAVLAAPDAVRG